MGFFDSLGNVETGISNGIGKVMQSPVMTRIRAGADLASRAMGAQPNDPNQQGLQGIRNDLSYLRSGTMALKPMNTNRKLYTPTSVQVTAGNPAGPDQAPQGGQGLYGVL